MKRAEAATSGPPRFFHAQGTRIVDETGQPVRLRGVAFGNQVYGKVRLPVTHHDEADYARLQAMGMNLVRFYIYYGTLESDAEPYHYRDDGWAWLDRNVEWARRHGVYLIFNMHVPPGGFQSLGQGGALWRDQANQKRFIALWRAIAARYANEPVVAGYDLLNEPNVLKNKREWQQLAQATAQAIREVDTHHPVIVERVNAVAGSWNNDGEMNFVTIDDPNVVYTFHFYEPFRFTHTHAPWANMQNVEGGQWNAEGAAKLRLAMAPYLAWGAQHDVPLYLGEFGLIRTAFQNNRNGLAWAADMIDLADEADLPWTWHAYHEDYFALYYGDRQPISGTTPNQGLIDLFTAKLAPR
ncbi:endoglucanase [Silvimonas amylolytica]|uniref:Endoglucanase n=2 Tax=Silvimonas amylolytica TaxID=449663 RepID=A0ABQ2PP53_9NEIS|nr:endoglucanase [Silvimonas amylolytica]